MWTGNPLSKCFDNLSNWQSMTHSGWHFISITKSKSLAVLGNGYRVVSRVFSFFSMLFDPKQMSCFLRVQTLSCLLSCLLAFFHVLFLFQDHNSTAYQQAFAWSTVTACLAHSWIKERAGPPQTPTKICRAEDQIPLVRRDCGSKGTDSKQWTTREC